MSPSATEKIISELEALCEAATPHENPLIFTEEEIQLANASRLYLPLLIRAVRAVEEYSKLEHALGTGACMKDHYGCDAKCSCGYDELRSALAAIGEDDAK